MNKVVINKCFGGFFSLSKKAKEILLNKGYKHYDIEFDNIPRHNKDLVEIVETLKLEASSEYSKLVIETIPGNKYYIVEYDGNEEIFYPEMNEWINIE